MGVRSIVGLAGRTRTCGPLVPNEVRLPLRYSEVVENTGVKPVSFACKANALSIELLPRGDGIPGRT